MKVTMIAAMSADGLIAQGKDQTSLDWTSKEDTRFFIEKTKEAGVLVMGRTTFETIGKPLKGRRTIVMTRKDLTSDMDGVEYTKQSPEEVIEMLSHDGCDQVVIAGGAQVYSAFLRAGLVTDVYLTIEPYLFGDGVPLVDHLERVDMRLLDVVQLNDKAVLLHYQI